MNKSTAQKKNIVFERMGGFDCAVEPSIVFYKPLGGLVWSSRGFSFGFNA